MGKMGKDNSIFIPDNEYGIMCDDECAKLSIEDGGQGLPESAYRENIQSLNRFDKSRSRESGGSGLGMSIMAAVIEKQGGKLTLRKSALGGLTVEAEVPTYRE